MFHLSTKFHLEFSFMCDLFLIKVLVEHIDKSVSYKYQYSK
jgi:hypothetical protein